MNTLLLLCIVAFASVQADKRLLSELTRSQRGCTKQCPENYMCAMQMCQACIPEPPSCKTHQCGEHQQCKMKNGVPVCIQVTCLEIRCAAGELCNERPDGPHCVPDVPSCKGFFCPRGTNCYVRGGSPTCLPNTCEIRKCKFGLTCIDTPSGALCRRGTKTKGCADKYCPPNSECIDEPPMGPHCVKI